MFLLGQPVSLGDARAAFAPLTLDECASLGVVAVGKQRVTGTIEIWPAETPEGRYLFAADRAPPGDDPAADHVMGVGASTRLLGALTLRRPVESALDLGTGCGYHAIRIARHAQLVIGTDVNPRALLFARFNAALNGVTNVEWRLGEWLQPVLGLRFDLIVSNPPFVVSPEHAFTFRDGGMEGDLVSRRLVEVLPEHLRPGGVAELLLSWIHDPDGSWSDPLRSWLREDAGCDAWFIRESSYDPEAYAALWNGRLVHDPPRYAATVERWVQHFAAEGVRALGYGAAILRKRAGPNWLRLDDLPPAGPTPDAGEQLAALFEIEDTLRTIDDATLLRRHVEVTPETRFDQSMRWRDGAFRAVDARLALDAGLRPTADANRVLTALLTGLDGRRSATDALALAVARLGLPAEEEGAFRTEALGTIRDLLAYGFLRFRRAED